MKYAAVIFCFFCIQAQAIDLSVSYQLASQVSVNWLPIDKFSGSFWCYPNGKPDEDKPGWTELITTNNSTPGTLSGSTWPISSHDLPFSLGSMQLAVSKMKSDPNTDSFVIQLVDNIAWSGASDRNDSDCVNHEFDWHVNSHTIRGQYLINIKLPNDTWVLKVKLRTQGPAAMVTKLVGGQPAAIHFLGDLHSMPVTVDKEMYVWGKPGTTVSLPFDVDLQSPGGKVGEVALDVTKIGLSGTNVINALNQVLKYDPTNATVSDYMDALASVAGHPDVAKKIVSSMGMQPIQALSDRLYEIAQGSFPDVEHELDVKSMASAAAYEFALALLDNMKVFCQTKKIELPLQGITVERPGFIIASFWMNQNIKRLADLNFPEVAAYLEELARWQDDHLTYADIAKDPNEFRKVRDGYIKVRMTTRLAQDVYGDIRGSLSKIISVFGTVGTDPMKVGQLMQRLQKLSALRAKINAQFQTLAFSFNIQNRNLIRVTPVLEQLQTLTDLNKQLADEMNSTLKFVSLGSTEPDSALNLMTRLLAHQVNIFDEPLRNAFQEPVRQAFLEDSRVHALKSDVAQCLGVVP